tara:strand:- start:421 stop:666 length:246 start_codon:yes stop_codon:yes gene_type:complete
MQVRVQFFSYFKDLTETSTCTLDVKEGCRLECALEDIRSRFPKLEAMRRCTLVAVGLDYVAKDHILQEGDEILLFPPVQGG